MKREDIEKVYDQGKEAVVNLVEGLINEFTIQIKALSDKVTELENHIEKIESGNEK